ncbi:hypothetical protein, conserved [Trypanosoma brucei gambiense DAL972]|uniref:Uncharacterized protein n=2 Tax=Trypanosoma brucei TaxID=5691 RepID=C9ZUW3_TRYB9|nr:hypothetical protein, conserved [Trypanosoma brucei gambiense DAL972]6HIV_BV Chain BV, mL88 [Trypanosoma brucei brucei]6HIX_BV Chain BV, ml88 [Trypanosoma brucei brucei]6YXX_BV Chain BV, mL88 [Trypanosoma brucei brucei]6YXY_BV Chain BV, mL88 [Trypanosoma brucei brucei]RHW70841.1 hypothetical protein DPX39_080019200 [Trypanosoma brucei equiperdum]CBH13201.1 hypothetical protein, conserved [Trypanosoma brucei gambiense DAL972]|eukprot:XP_011775478.1 hypothetical protein, conserved [Trypanosoma brucei gambiense DAL972]
MLQINAFKLVRATPFLLKRTGKPADTPDYKQVYLPYDAAPTERELERERRRFKQAYHGRMEHRKLVEVKEVPLNVYTYGKEGMSLPIAIFKDQKDPVIGPEWTYPGIYENKIAAQHWYTEELFDKESKEAFESPWQQQILDNQVKRRMAKVMFRMRQVNMKAVDLFQKERGSSRRSGGAGEKGKDGGGKK